MLPPLPRCSRRAYSSLNITHPWQPSPIPLSGRPAHRPFRGLLSVHSRCGLHTRAVTKFVTAIRGLQTFRHLHACPGCFRLERPPGGACTRWRSAALARRTWKSDARHQVRADRVAGGRLRPPPWPAATDVAPSLLPGRYPPVRTVGRYAARIRVDCAQPLTVGRNKYIECRPSPEHLVGSRAVLVDVIRQGERARGPR
jgi:hypothetical protein